MISDQIPRLSTMTNRKANEEKVSRNDEHRQINILQSQPEGLGSFRRGSKGARRMGTREERKGKTAKKGRGKGKKGEKGEGKRRRREQEGKEKKEK